MGEVEVKNIARPVRVFRVRKDGVPPVAPVRRTATNHRHLAVAAVLIVIAAGVGLWRWQPWAGPANPLEIAGMKFPLPDKPSVAVLPFTNLSADKEQEYFSDGITEDIITDLAKVSGLFVVARNSSFSFKRKAVNVRQVA